MLRKYPNTFNRQRHHIAAARRASEIVVPSDPSILTEESFDSGSISSIWDIVNWDPPDAYSDTGGYYFGINGYETIGANKDCVVPINNTVGDKVRVDLVVRFDDTTLDTVDTTYRTYIMIFPEDDAIEGFTLTNPISQQTSSMGSIIFDRLNNVLRGSTASRIRMRVDDNGTWWSTYRIVRQGYHKLSIIIDKATATYKVYCNDQLVRRATSIQSNSNLYTIGRLVISQSSTGPDMKLSYIKITENYTDPVDSWALAGEHDFTLETGDLFDLSPTTNNYDYQGPVRWTKPDDTSAYSGITCSSSGAKASGTNKTNALVNMTMDGKIELDISTSDVVNRTHIGPIFRCYSADQAGGGQWKLLFYQTAGLWNLSFESGGTSWASEGPGATIGSSYAPGLGSFITIRVEFEGGYYRINIIDAGTEYLQFSSISDSEGWFPQVASMLQGDERGIGNYVAGGFEIGSNASSLAVKAIRWYGKDGELQGSTVRNELSFYSIGGGVNYYLVQPGSVIEHTNSILPNTTFKNLAKGKYQQLCHYSKADLGRWCIERTLFNNTNVWVAEQWMTNQNEFGACGIGKPVLVATLRGWYFYEKEDPGGASDFTTHFYPERDLEPTEWSNSEIAAGGTSGAATYSHLPFEQPGDTWGGSFSDAVAVAQSITTASGNKMLMTCGFAFPNAQYAAFGTFSMREQNTGGNFTKSFGLRTSNVLSGLQSFSFVRFSYYEVGAVSQNSTEVYDTKEWYREMSSGSPAWGHISVSTGTLKTDSSYDPDEDGFAEIVGWFELNASSNICAWTLNGNDGSSDRIILWPQFRIHGISAGGTLTAGATTLVNNSDYVIDDLGDGSYLIQILSKVSGDVDYVYTS